MSWFEWTFNLLLKSPVIWMLVPISISGWLLFYRRDERSAIEAFLIAWLVAFCGITSSLISAGKSIGIPSYHRWIQEFVEQQRFGLVCGLLIAIIFSIPIVPGLCCRETVKISWGARWMMLAVMMVALDLTLYVLWMLVDMSWSIPSHAN